jgi:non-ribosomal peptide synthetase component F
MPGFDRLDSFLAMSAITFDISLAELLLPLYTGGAFIAAPPGTRLDPAVFAHVVEQFSPNVIQATPSFFRLALTWGWQGNPNSRIWCGGEALTPTLARSLMARCTQLWNVYGPTETTLWSTAALVTSAEAIGLGRPLPGTGIFLEDASGSPGMAPGVRGEILLYGTGMADGYINQPELTAERFCEHLTPEGYALCYRTGDLAAYRNDGTLQFLGRIDSQVKLRGHRIELGEVEAVIEEHPSVRESVAVLRDREHPARARIAVFVVTDGTIGQRDIRSWLSHRLPPGMRPGEILLRAALPRTPSGKIDRLALLGESA